MGSGRGTSLVIHGENVRQPDYLSVRMFRVGARLFLDYVEVRAFRFDQSKRYRPVIIGDHVELREIDGTRDIAFE